jgi:glycine/D-amino acid oxidase-like deaminating enzyme
MTDDRVARALAAARPVPFWLDQPDAPVPPRLPPLTARIDADLAVVGGGFTGLWTALLAKEADPGRDVVLLEARRVAWAATGRNGGFCAASLTHGLGNGQDRFPGELATLERLGRRNLDEIETAVARYQIDCGFARTGELAVATQQWQADGLQETAAIADRLGVRMRWLDQDAVRAELHSPAYLAGLWDTDGCAMVDPARLAFGLRRACLAAGVRIYEHTTVTGVASEPGPSGRLVLQTVAASPADVADVTDTPGAAGVVRACQVALAAGTFAPLLRRLRYYLIPVYDYALVTEPLTAGQLASIGWPHRQGVGDSANQFHYYRLTGDNRILWGGYDAIYPYGSRISDSSDQRPATFAKLASHFFATFPQLDGISFSHKWGGVIDTCSRFCAFFGTAHRGRLAYAAGYTGLGVGASRFGGQVMLDLLGGQPTELTELELVRTRPLPFPPEPLRFAGVQLSRWSLARADARGGRRNLWLRAMDAIGLGFDS